MHLRMGAALDQEGVLAPADLLEAIQEVGDELDLEVLNLLELHIAPHGALVAGALGAERHDRHDRVPACLSRLHRVQRLRRLDKICKSSGNLSWLQPRPFLDKAAKVPIPSMKPGAGFPAGRQGHLWDGEINKGRVRCFRSFMSVWGRPA